MAQERRWKLTPQAEAVLRYNYTHFRGARPGALRRCMRELGWPAWIIHQTARELLLVAPRGPRTPWSDAEDQILERYAYQQPQAIQAHLLKELQAHRTMGAIKARLVRQRLLHNLDGMNLTELAEAFGVAPRIIHRWVDAGWIRAVVRFPEAAAVGRSPYFFSHDEIRRFIRQHSEVYTLRQISCEEWFKDMAFG